MKTTIFDDNIIECSKETGEMSRNWHGTAIALMNVRTIQSQ
jgi:hypothetical protein